MMTIEGNAMVMCRCDSASMPPADFRLYNITGKSLLGKQHVPLFHPGTRKPRDATIRRDSKTM